MVECSIHEEESTPKISREVIRESYWLLHVHDASNTQGSKASLILANPKGAVTEHALRFNFKTFNNGTEYESLITGLRMKKDLNVKKLIVFANSQLIIGQVQDQFEAKDSIIS